MHWWSTPSIRVRLTGWYTVVLFLMMVVYATATFVAVRHEFLEQLDDQLHDDFETAEGFLAPAPDVASRGRAIAITTRTTTKPAAARCGPLAASRSTVRVRLSHYRPSPSPLRQRRLGMNRL